jgi:hypothetical protein
MSFASPEEAFEVLCDPSHPSWGEVFEYLLRHPQTSQVMVDSFRETLEQMGVMPSGLDPVTDAPVYILADVARAMGLAEEDLDTNDQQHSL